MARELDWKGGGGGVLKIFAHVRAECGVKAMNGRRVEQGWMGSSEETRDVVIHVQRVS